MTSEATVAAAIPPQGVEPNFINPSSLYPQMLATVVLCSSLTTLFTFARLFTRWAISTWASEDYLLMLAWAFNMAYDYVFLVQGQIGTGRHIWDVRAMETVNMAKCIPRDKIWNPEHKGGHCINFDVAALATGSVNVISDFLILLLPLVAIWRLRMAPKRKLGVSAVFATGLLAFVSSICRLAYTTRFFTSRDATYIPAQAGMWTLAECATLILVTCFPVMPRFAQLIFSKTGHSRDTESYPPYQAGRNTLGIGGTALRLHRPNRSEAWIKTGDAMAPPKNAYIPLGEHGYMGPSRPFPSVGHSGIQRTVSIELTSHALSSTGP